MVQDTSENRVHELCVYSRMDGSEGMNMVQRTTLGRISENRDHAYASGVVHTDKDSDGVHGLVGESS